MQHTKLIEYATARKKEGWKIVLVRPNSKKGTANRDASLAQLKAHIQAKGNVGGIPPREIAVIDVDTHGSNGHKSCDTLCERFDIRDSMGETTTTPTGGEHIFISVPRKYRTRLRSAISFEPGLDLIYGSLYVVFPYSVRDDGEYILHEDGYHVNYIANSEFWEYLCDPKIEPKEENWSIGSRNVNLYREAIQIFDTVAGKDERVTALNKLIQKAKSYATPDNPFPTEEIKRTIESAERRYLKKVESLQDSTGGTGFDPSIQAAVMRFFHVRADDLLFVSEGTALSIMTWSINRWVYDEDNLIALILDNETEIVRTAVINNILTAEQARMYLNNLRDKNKAKTIATFMVPEYLNLRKNNAIPKGIIEIPNWKVNAHDEWIIFKNGGVNLTTGETIPIWETKSLYSTMTIDYDYDLNARSTLVTEFISGKEQFVNGIAGSLKGGPCRDLGIVLGETGTGKTTFSEVVALALQDYAMTSSLEFLSATDDPSRPDPHLVSAANGCRVLLGSDVAGYVNFSRSNIKRIVGSETISARELHKGTRTYRLSFTIFIGENDIPYTGISRDKAIAARLKFMRCEPFSHEIDTSKLKKIEHLQALSAALINKSIELSGGEWWPNQEEFKIDAIESEWPDYVLKLHEEYEITRHKSKVIKTSEMYDMLKMYFPKVTRRTMTTNIAAYFERNYEVLLTRSNGQKVWKGLELRLKNTQEF